VKNITVSVLYVDDEPGLLTLAKTYLERNGEFSVDTLTTAQSALKQLTTVSYDAIISDYQMPKIDGIKFLIEVRSTLGDIPFILFTGRGREDVVIEAINNGADFYLQKGGDPKSQFAELTHKIKKAVEQRQAEKALKGSEQRLSDIINFLPDATFAIDLSGTVIAWNQAMEEMTGVPQNTIIGTGDYSYALPFYSERRPLLLDLVLRNDEKIKEKYPYVQCHDKKFISQIFIRNLYNGKGAYLWFVASPLYDTNGTITGAIESIRDITEQKQLEQERNAAHEELAEKKEKLRKNYDELTNRQNELVKSEERYRNVVEDQTEFISRFLPDGTHVFVNDAYCNYFGKSRSEIIGHVFRPLIPKEDKLKLKEHFTSFSPRNPVNTVDHRIIMRDGSVCWQRWSDRAIFDEWGATIEYQSVGRDITDIKRAEIELNRSHEELLAAYEQIAAAEEELRSNYEELAHHQKLLQESENRYRNIVEDQTEFISRFLPDGTHVFVNGAYCRCFGKTRDEITGHVFIPDIPEEDRAIVRQHFQSLTPENPVAIAAHRIIVPDGSVHWHRWSDRAIFDDTGSIVEYQSVGRDITDIKRAEIELSRSHEELLAAYEQIAAVEEELRSNYEELAHHQKLLQESENRYRNIVEDQTEFISRFLPDGTHVFVNGAYCRCFGKTRDEITGHVFIPDIPEEDRAIVRQHFQSLTPENPVAIAAHRIIMPDGSVHWHRWSDRAIFDDTGAIIEYQSVGRDITGQKQIEEALRKSEGKYRELVENANSIILKWDTTGKITFFNEFAQRFFGYTPDEIIGKPVMGIIIPVKESGSQRDLSLMIDAIIRHPEDHILNENENITRDGKRVWIQWQNKSILDENGQFVGLLSIGTDITERKQTEMALLESESFNRGLVENLPDYIVVCGLDGKILYVNPASVKVAGYCAEALIGTSVLSLVAHEDRDTVIAHMNARRNEGEVPKYEIDIITVNGTRRSVIVQGTKIQYQNNPAILLHLNDITERNLLEMEMQYHEQELRQFSTALEIANKKLTLLSSITRHDINNQLTVLMGYLDLLKMNQPELSSGTHFGNIIIAAERIQEMIQFTKTYESIGVNAPVWYNIRTLVDTAAKDVDLGHIRLINSLPARTTVFADQLIVKVFFNLIDNAVRYGGKITNIRFSARIHNGDFIIACEDDGDGVPSEEKEKIFQRGLGKNTGLGLFLSREILLITGISILETGEAGNGARFEMTVPPGIFR